VQVTTSPLTSPEDASEQPRRAAVVQRVDRRADARDEHRRVAHLDRDGLAVPEVFGGQSVGPVLRAGVEDGRVHAHPLAEGEVTAEVPARARDAEARKPERHALGAVAAPAVHQRGAVEGEGRRVGRGVHKADAAHAVVAGLAVGPVAGTGQRGRAVRGDPDADQPLRRALAVPAADEVEHGCAGPAADHDVGQQRMQGVPDPRAADRVAQHAGPDRPADGFGDLAPGGVERANRFDDVGGGA